MAMAAAILADPSPAHPDFWGADDLTRRLLVVFQAAHDRADARGQRNAFFQLARYHHRTLAILRSSLAERHEPLAQAALRNLTTLHQALATMHRAAATTVPVVMTLTAQDRVTYARDLVVRVVEETGRPASARAIAERVRQQDTLGTVPDRTVYRHLLALEASGHVVRRSHGYTRTHLPYAELDVDAAGLTMLLGPALHARLSGAGFHGLREVEREPARFATAFTEAAGLADARTGALCLAAVTAFLAPGGAATVPWSHADLIASAVPRPFQRRAFAAFRDGGYQGLVLEAPTGSGKTLVGLLCVQDWLAALQRGQSVLILVPTNNYQLQWVHELCLLPIGLRLAPEAVFAGTSTELIRLRRRTGQQPGVLILTYTGLARLCADGSTEAAERFLDAAGVQYVLLDEVHKVLEAPASPTGELARRLVARLRRRVLRGLIGFSGTVAAFREPLAALGLRLAESVPVGDLVAAGFIAPFTEFGVPYAYSARESAVRDRLDRYKRQLRRWLDLIGAPRLRVWLAAIPADEQRRLAHEVIGLYRGQADWAAAVDRRRHGWLDPNGQPLGVHEWPLPLLVQLANGWSDAELARQAGLDAAVFDALLAELDATRQELAASVGLPRLIARLTRPGFGHSLDAAAAREAAHLKPPAMRPDAVRFATATTIAGLYAGLVEWYQHTGEGRVDTIRSVIAAERAARPVPAVIVFDAGRHIAWREPLPAPGYVGAGGLFAHLLGDPTLRPLAVLSNELYLPHDGADPAAEHVAEFIEARLMRERVAGAVADLALDGLSLPGDAVVAVRERFDAAVAELIPALRAHHAPRPALFDRHVLRPLRQHLRHARLGPDGERLRLRLDAHNPHLRRLVQTWLDYAALAAAFRQVQVRELVQADGARQPFGVVRMPSASRRRQLAYELAARLVDEPSLGFDIVVVSNWARTGWNVVRPNVLIDATATRDPVAWQQLRGRALRPAPTWTPACAGLLAALTCAGPEATVPSPPGDLPVPCDGLVAPEVFARLATGGPHALTDAERRELAVTLLLARNKVAHTYELVKAAGRGQVVYDRHARLWRRRPAIAAKHEHTESVDPLSGQVVRGQRAAPLIYAGDPRRDLPHQLGRRLTTVLTGRDAVVVAGWLRRFRPGPLDPLRRPDATGAGTEPDGAAPTGVATDTDGASRPNDTAI